MDMQIDSDFIKREREKRAWSQGQLADIAGLSLRTIQRVENTGAASYETVKSIAAALDIKAEELILAKDLSGLNENGKKKIRQLPKLLGAGFVGAMVTCASLFLLSEVHADEILMDIDYTSAGTTSKILTLANALDQEAEFTIDDEFRITVTPKLTKTQNVLLMLKIYQRLDGEYQLISEPRIITANLQKAEIIVNHQEENELAVRITPYYGLL